MPPLRLLWNAGRPEARIPAKFICSFSFGGFKEGEHAVKQLKRDTSAGEAIQKRPFSSDSCGVCFQVLHIVTWCYWIITVKLKIAWFLKYFSQSVTAEITFCPPSNHAAIHIFFCLVHSVGGADVGLKVAPLVGRCLCLFCGVWARYFIAKG